MPAPKRDDAESKVLDAVALVEISTLEPFAQVAFRGTTKLNRMQVRVCVLGLLDVLVVLCVGVGVCVWSCVWVFEGVGVCVGGYGWRGGVRGGGGRMCWLDCSIG